MIRDIALRVSSDLKNLSIALIKCHLLESENWKLVGKAGDDFFEIVSKKNQFSGNGLELENLKINECFYKHAKEYRMFDCTGDYTFKLFDGSLIQISYLFYDNKLTKQRLAYFQKPYSNRELDYLDGFDDSEEESEKNLKMGLVWLRFDYDPGKGIEILHPNAHLTVSNYKNCRIPVSSPMTAKQFVDMIVLNFYEDNYDAYDIQSKKTSFLEALYSDTFFTKEKSIFRIHTGS